MSATRSVGEARVPPPPGRAVLTIAVGKPLYVRFASNLARSFQWWNRGRGIRFVLVTDQPASVPRDLRGVEVLSIPAGAYGDGFSPKLHLDRLAPAAQTLFLDADCLCVGALDSVFERFAGRPVSVVGGTIDDGEWFGDVSALREEFGVPALPKFNGGVYYLEPGAECTAVYDTARSLEPRYDELGMRRLRGKANEEILLAVAMAVHDRWGIAEDGTIMAEPLNFASGVSVDVLAGRATLHNRPGHREFRPGWPLREAHPLIVHFLGSFTDRGPYAVEEHRLGLVARGWPAWWARLYGGATRLLPYRASEALREALRPLYRRLFGTRAVPVSERV